MGRDSIGSMTKKILTVLESDACCAESVTKRVHKFVYPDHR